MLLKMMQSAQYETLCICVACAMCIEALSTLAGRLHHKVHSALSTIHPLSKHYAVQPHGSRDAHISPNSPPRPSRRLKMRIVRVIERKYTSNVMMKSERVMHLGKVWFVLQIVESKSRHIQYTKLTPNI